MEKLKTAKALGEKIIESQHDLFVATSREHLNHIIGLKRMIAAISDYLKSESIPGDKAD